MKVKKLTNNQIEILIEFYNELLLDTNYYTIYAEILKKKIKKLRKKVAERFDC
jgi:hypothetical protein